ncbi:MAG: hypothetical protein K8S99_03150 [Planctomycetes bacterium]|nr:hypothetical protein [Planctomycetota bacterium]
MPGSTITLPLPARFDLTRAICSYGYFILAPNHWDTTTQRFHRPLRGNADRLIHVTLSQRPRSDLLKIACDTRVDRAERALLFTQLRRILRLDEPESRYRAWRKLHPEAARRGFGRVFRSPTFFEDIVKTMTSCNVTWPNTMRMNVLLTARVGNGAFPTPGELAGWSPEKLKASCRVGYRAERIVKLARDVVDGRLDLAPLEDMSRTTDDVFGDLLEIHGIGPYAAANICQLLGRYDRLPIDTETYRHFRQEHGVRHKADGSPRDLHGKIERHYKRYAPFQFLAYWFELWRAYERRVGDAWNWDAAKHGPTFTAANLKDAPNT